MSEADVTEWINLNKIKIIFQKTHQYKFWSLRTSQVEDEERTVERIFQITTNPVRNVKEP